MNLSQEEKAIIEYLKSGIKEKQQIVNKFKSWYPKNSNIKISNILANMYYYDKIKVTEEGKYYVGELEKEEEEETESKQIKLF